MRNELTRDVCALVDVSDGVTVLEAELLLERVPRPSLAKTVTHQLDFQNSNMVTITSVKMAEKNLNYTSINVTLTVAKLHGI